MTFISDEPFELIWTNVTQMDANFEYVLYRRQAYKVVRKLHILSSVTFLSPPPNTCTHTILLPPLFIVLQLQPLKLDNTMGDKGGGQCCGLPSEARGEEGLD